MSQPPELWKVGEGKSLQRKVGDTFFFFFFQENRKKKRIRKERRKQTHKG